VVWFLNDRVLAPEIRASRYTKGRTTADGAPVRQTLGMSAVKSYVAAIVDLWYFQKSKGFSACGRGSRGCQCLERQSRVSGRASENRCPGRAILPPIPQLLK
jgi:hypothetical protein